MDKEKFSRIVKRYLDGKASQEEKRFVEAYYNELHSGKPIEFILSENQVEALEKTIYDNIRAGISGAPVKHIGSYKKYVQYAAAAAVLLMIGTAGILYRNISSRNSYETVYAEAGKVKKVQLSDGTIVWLNAKSKIKYPESFAGLEKREVYLEGEGYFEVVKDKKHPFMVHTQELTTRVLGTKFNVKAYNTKAIEVTLVEGKVMLTAAGHVKKGDTLYLTPNQKALYALQQPKVAMQPNAGATQVETNDAPLKITLSKRYVLNAVTASVWRNGELVFDNEPLKDVLATLSRKYNVKIEAAPDLADLAISARVTAEPIEDVLLKITRQLKHSVNRQGTDYETRGQFKKVGANYYIE